MKHSTRLTNTHINWKQVQPIARKEVRKDIKNKWENTNANIIDMKVAVDSVKDSVGEFTKKSIPTLQSTVREVKMIINTWKDEIQPKNFKNIEVTCLKILPF